jgi:hypothetical protein
MQSSRPVQVSRFGVDKQYLVSMRRFLTDVEGVNTIFSHLVPLSLPNFACIAAMDLARFKRIEETWTILKEQKQSRTLPILNNTHTCGCGDTSCRKAGKSEV